MSSVDVVIPVYKPDKKLNMVISRLMHQTVQPETIYVINTKCPEHDCETKKLLYKITEEYSNVKILEVAQEEYDHGGTRDMAVRISRADYVLMMTMDAVPKNRKLVENLLKAQGHQIAAVYARQEPEKNCRLLERYARAFNYPDEESSAIETAAKTNNGIKSIFCSDVCAMYDRKAYDEVGGFPGRTIFNEDEIFAAKSLKAGFDIIYQPSAVVIHSHNYTGIQYFKRYFDLGVSHRDFSYIFREYHTEDEGIRLVKSTIRYLVRRKRYFDIPVLIYHSAMKYLGMNLGKMYKSLPKEVVLKCTANQYYWKQERS
jgi:rhamnosyltransferase